MKKIKLHDTTNSLTMEVKKLVHDLRSPLAALKMVYEASKHLLPEQNSKAAQNATYRLEGIINRLLNSDGSIFVDAEKINLHTSITRILSEKDMEYHNSNVDIYYSYTSDAEKANVCGYIDDFERMLSNLINNAVEACIESSKNKDAIVMINLLTLGSKIFLTLGDNGKGMTLEVLQKLRNGVAVTSGKENGHGIGFVQIKDTIRKLNGDLDIESRLGDGTTMTITFNRN